MLQGISALVIVVVSIFIALIPIIILVYCMNRLNRTALATEQTQRLVERLLKVAETVAKAEHPELYDKKKEVEESDKSEK